MKPISLTPIAVCCALQMLLLASCGSNNKDGSLTSSDVAQPGQIIPATEPCAPNQQTCDGDKRLTCSTDGKSWIVDTCACGCNDESGVITCKTAECPAEISRCRAGTIEHCSTNGCWEPKETCEMGCFASQTYCLKCKPGERRCDDGGNVETCAPSGLSFIKTEACDGGCDNERSECSQCKPGTLRCKIDGPIERCADDGRSWVAEQSCADGCNPETVSCNSCKPGELACRFGNVVSCNPQGETWTLAEPCQLGCDAASVSCFLCKPGSSRCRVDGHQERCAADGSAWEPVFCQYGCNDATGTCRTCQPGVRECDQSGNLRACNSAGNGWTTSACKLGCDASTLQCFDCKPDELRCNPQGAIERCAASGLTWTLKQVCPAGCNAKTIACDVCKAGESKCDGSAQLSCKSDGSGWDSKSCAQGCNPQNGACRFCTAGATRCNGSAQLEECNGNGTAFVVGEQCPVGCKDDHFGARCVDPQAFMTFKSGLSTSCGIREHDRSLWCWGFYYATGVEPMENQPAPVRVGQAGDRWKAVSGAQYHGCAIKEDDSLWCWGFNGFSQLGLTTPSFSRTPLRVDQRSWRAVAVGMYHTCAITTQGELHCWGRNEVGQLGRGIADGSNDKHLPGPAQVPDGIRFRSINAWQNASCAIEESDDGSGRLWCWGKNQSGALGLADSSSGPLISALLPTLVHETKRWRAHALGQMHSCAIADDHALWCWGLQSAGILGPGISVTNYLPSQTDSGPWLSVCAGWSHTCAVRTDHTTDHKGDLYCWGSNYSGQLGTTTPFASMAPVGEWVSVDAGQEHGCGQRWDGTLWCWGRSLYGVLGVGELGYRTLPQQVGDAKWTALSTGHYHSCAIDAQQHLFCWGYNASGELGLGHRKTQLAPQQVGTGTWSSVSAGNTLSCAIDTTKGLWCWGSNYAGQTGTNDAPTLHETPKQVAPGSQWLQVSTSNAFACALKSDSTLWCFGQNSYGNLGDGTKESRPVPTAIAESATWLQISVGTYHACGIRTDGTLWCWGRNANGQLGLDGKDDRTTPTQVDSNSWRVVSATDNGTCAVREDHSLWCWGSGGGFYLQTPTRIGDGFSSVTTGQLVSCGVRTDGQLWCIGSNQFGQLGLGLGATKNQSATGTLLTAPGKTWLGVGAGSVHLCGIQSDGSLWCWGSLNRGVLGLGISDVISTPTQVTFPTK